MLRDAHCARSSAWGQPIEIPQTSSWGATEKVASRRIAPKDFGRSQTVFQRLAPWRDCTLRKRFSRKEVPGAQARPAHGVRWEHPWRLWSRWAPCRESAGAFHNGQAVSARRRHATERGSGKGTRPPARKTLFDPSGFRTALRRSAIRWKAHP